MAYVKKDEMTAWSDKCYKGVNDGQTFGLKLKKGVRSLRSIKLGLF